MASDLDFYISAKVGEYAKVYSKAVKVSITPMEAVVPEADLYDKVWVIGDYCGWNHGNTQFLFDYAKDGNTYSGVVDFGGKAANGWKITGVAGWDDTCNWGLDGDAATPEDEAAAIQLISSGGSKDIKIYSKRFYNFEFDKSSLTLKVKKGFDALGVIGDFNGWGADVEMKYNPSLVRFFADVEIPADGGFKVRVAGSWNNGDWGASEGDATAGPIPTGGNNVSVKAGKYRIYLDLNKGTIEASAKMFGQEEPGYTESSDDQPDTPALSGWGVVGQLTGWADGADIAMAQNLAVWSAKNVELKAGEGWKIRKDGGWDVNRGAAGDVEPFAVTVGEKLAVVAGGKNLAVPADGAYDIYFDEGHNELYVLTAGSAAPAFETSWFLCGGMNNWTAGDTKYLMTFDGTYWVLKGFTVEADTEMKFNVGSWDDELTGSFSANAAFSVAKGGSNMKVAAGTYDVYLDAANGKAYFMTDGKTPADAGEAEVKYIDASNIVVGFSGTFNGWGDPTPATFEAKDVTDAATFAGKYTYKLTGFELANGVEFKIRVNGEWIGAAGATVEGIAASGTDNFLVGEGGTFNVAITFAWDGLKPSDVKAVFSK